MPKPRYNHAFTIAFEVRTDHKADSVTADELLEALSSRLSSLRSNPEEIIEAAGMPYDTFEEDNE